MNLIILEQGAFYNIYTQICGLIIAFIILVLYISQKKMNIRREKHFIRMILVVILVLGLDIWATIANTVDPLYNNPISNYVNRLYLAAMVISIFGTGLYLLSEISSRKVYSIIFWLLTIALTAICAFIVNPYWSTLENNLENDNGRNVYTYGSSVIACFGTGFTGILTIFIMSIVFRKKVAKKRIIAIRFWMILWTGFSITQYFIKSLLIVSFALSLGLLIMYMSLESLDGILDNQTGLFNWNGYVKYVEERRKDKKVCEIIYLKALDSIKIIDDKTKREGLNQFNKYLLKSKEFLSFRIRDEYILVLKSNVTFQEIIERFLKDIEQFPIISTHYFIFYLDDAIKLENETSISSLIDLAAKNINKTMDSYIIIDTTILEDHYANIQIESLIEKAIKEDRVIVYYQPIYNLKTKTFTCAEALVRIETDDGKLLPPGMFIPIAEKNGMIHRLDEMVFDKVCKFTKENNMDALGLHYIESNLSVAQLCDKELSKKYIDIMKENKVESKYINLEITESAELDQKNTLTTNLRKLKAKGVTFSLDDYGTGYSNLNYVVEMPADIIKFDKQMIDAYFNAYDNPTDDKAQRCMRVMETSIAMFKSLKLDIVCEGIERQAQEDVLNKMGVDYIQGYLHSKPLSKSEFIDFIQEHNNGIKKEEVKPKRTKKKQSN